MPFRRALKGKSCRHSRASARIGPLEMEYLTTTEPGSTLRSMICKAITKLLVDQLQPSRPLHEVLASESKTAKPAGQQPWLRNQRIYKSYW